MRVELKTTATNISSTISVIRHSIVKIQLFCQYINSEKSNTLCYWSLNFALYNRDNIFSHTKIQVDIKNDDQI